MKKIFKNQNDFKNQNSVKYFKRNIMEYGLRIIYIPLRFLIMIFFLFSLSLFYVRNAEAVTKGYFAFGGEQLIITMKSHSVLGDVDAGPEKLYNSLKVTPENSFIGKGKVLKDSRQGMTFIVADRGQGHYEVSIVLKKSENTQLDPFRKFAEIRVQGVEALTLFKLWNSNNARYEFVNLEGSLKLSATPDLFVLSFQE